MTTDIQALAAANLDKAIRTLSLVKASLADYRPFDPSSTYTPKALEMPLPIALSGPSSAVCATSAARKLSNLANNPKPRVACSIAWKKSGWSAMPRFG